jgi:hypothetical protein
VEIINNLMSSQKISDRALRCAAIPTVSAFYKLYPNANCMRFPERTDLKIEPISFKDFHERFVKKAKPRTTIFDYRHCMRILHGLLEGMHAKIEEADDVSKLGIRLVEALEAIHDLRNRQMLLH